MKLQLALDMLSLEEAISVVEHTRDYIDIIEVGTPLLKYQGVRAIKELKNRFGEKEIFADAKCMDVGEYEADFCFKAGANLFSVLGVADDETIKGAVKSANAYKCGVLVDLINVTHKLARARELERLGAHGVGIHSGIDQQRVGITPLRDLGLIVGAVSIPVTVAGGINLSTIEDIVSKKPDTVVVGGAITSSKDPAATASRIKAVMRTSEIKA